MKSQHRPPTAADYRERILRVLVYIQNHLDADLSLDDLASLACFSPFHFHRVFRGLVGEGVKEHVRRLRLERAAHQLKFGDEQVVAIALSAGYEAHESFTRAFTATFGAPPSEFRRTHRSVEYPPAPSGVHYRPGAREDEINLQDSKGPTLEISIERLADRSVAFVRHIGPYDEVGGAWGRLFAWAGPRGLIGASLDFFGLCHDDPEVTPPDRVRYDACLVVGPEVKPEGEIGVQQVTGGEFAAALHVGPYGTLGRTYAAICGPWLLVSSRALGAPPCVEFYLDDPRSTPEDRLRTKVYMRLA